MTRFLLAALGLAVSTLAIACAPEGEEPNPFHRDCQEQLNDSRKTASPIPATEGFVEEALEICAGDVDLYTIVVAPGELVWVEMTFSHATADLDMDLYNAAEQRIATSASGLNYERVSIVADEKQEFFVRVYGASTVGQGTYDLTVRAMPWAEDLACTDDCYRIIPFPAPMADDNYMFDSVAEFRNARRELAYIVRYALDKTYERYPSLNPLGLIDMSERDGDTPGRSYGQLRHPEGTHVEGNDMDIAYFQTGPDNHARSVCANDGYFCTSESNTMDAQSTAFFMANLFSSHRIRVIGVDTTLHDDLVAAAGELFAAGEIDSFQRGKFNQFIASGSGWPFHQHHLHLSLQWTDGYELTHDTRDEPHAHPVNPYPEL